MGRRLELRLGKRLRVARYIEVLSGQSSGSHWGHREIQSCKMGQGRKHIQSHRIGEDCKQALIDREGGDQRKDYLIDGQEKD